MTHQSYHSQRKESTLVRLDLRTISWLQLYMVDVWKTNYLL